MASYYDTIEIPCSVCGERAPVSIRTAPSTFVCSPKCAQKLKEAKSS